MDENNQDAAGGEAASAVPESPKPLAFTIDFGSDKKIDVHRHKTLAEKFQKRHKRGQSLSKLEDSNPAATPKHPLTGNLPRKSSFQSEGYFSSDEKPERLKNAKTSAKRSDLTLFLRNVTSERMTQSFPNHALPSIDSPQECELKDISSPELDLISPYSPKEHEAAQIANTSSSEEVFIDGNEFDFDKNSDAVSDTGTYTVDAENYSEEQKARMSIDREFKIEKVSVQKKTEEYIQSLVTVKEQITESSSIQITRPMYVGNEVIKGIKDLNVVEELKSPRSPIIKPKLSPILSPTQNMSIVEAEKPLNNGECDLNKTFTKILYPSPKAKTNGIGSNQDHGSVISVTSSGAFRVKPEDKKKLERRHSLTKSEVQVQAYIDGRSVIETVRTNNTAKLTANIVNVQSIDDTGTVISGNIVVGKVSNITCGLPPAVGGKTSPTKIPSPIHTMSRPRSRNSMNLELSDDTEVILKPTQNYINSLQQRLSLDSDPDSDYDAKYGLQLNNTAHLLKQRASHTRHNSLDDRTMNNKLEHFQSKNLQGIDQTYSNLLNQYSQTRTIQKIHNSPNNSPIRRSSSFSTKNQIAPKNTNMQKESNILCNSPNLTRNNSIQRSSSTACIKPNFLGNRRSSITDHKKIDRSQFGDTESSSEEDFEKNLQRRKDLGNISNTRCNRAFSLRRARIDNEPGPLKCPNTPEMRRKTFQTDAKQERAISVDRKPVKTSEVPSRYLNLGKRVVPPPATKEAKAKAPTPVKPTNKVQAFARTDSGRFSMRTAAKPAGSLPKTPKSGKKETPGSAGKKQQPGGGARSNSSLSSREVEFQNWKRRKSYDPMKAAAEGRRREAQQRRERVPSGSGGAAAGDPMARSCTDAARSPDSSPSRSGSVHRSQSFHGTAAMEQLASSDDDDLTLSADEGFSPPTPSPCELSPARATLRHRLWDRLHN